MNFFDLIAKIEFFLKINNSEMNTHITIYIHYLHFFFIIIIKKN